MIFSSPLGRANSPFVPPGAREGCVVCEQLGASEPEFPVNGAEPPGDITAAREAIVDALGFCEDHGAALLRRSESRMLARMLARILGDATESIVGRLGDEKRYADRMLEVFFGIGQACPVCKLRSHRITHEVHRLARACTVQAVTRELCFAHYRDVANTVNAATLPVLADARRKLLESILDGIGRIPEEPYGEDGCSSIEPEKLSWATRLVVGGPVLVGQVPVGTTGPRDRIGEPCVDELSCPVCTGIRREEVRWLEMTKTAVRLGRDLWTVLPTCARHVRQCARCDDENVALAATRYAAGVQLTSLSDGIAALVQDNRSREAARQSVFYRRKSPAYILGRQRKMVTNLPRCPACERLVVAQDRDIMQALQGLRSGRHDHPDGYFARFCLKHFGAVYAYTTPGEARSRLVGIQVQRFGELRAHLARAADRGGAVALEHSLQQAMRAWCTAMW